MGNLLQELVRYNVLVDYGRMHVSDIDYFHQKQNRIDSFLKLVAPFGILESARSGLMALPRSPLYGPNEEVAIKDADEIVDASQLPPG